MKLIYLNNEIALIKIDTDAITLHYSCVRKFIYCGPCIYRNNCAVSSSFTVRVTNFK